MMMKGTQIQDTESNLEAGEMLYKMIRKFYPNKQIIVCSAKDRKSVEIDFSNNDTKYIAKPLTEENLAALLKEVNIRV